MKHKDYVGARRKLLDAQKSYLGLEYIDELIKVGDIVCTAESQRKSGSDWHLVLQTNKAANGSDIVFEYTELVRSLEPVKNKFPETQSAFGVIEKAYCVLSDREKRCEVDSRRAGSLGSCGSAVPLDIANEGKRVEADEPMVDAGAVDDSSSVMGQADVQDLGSLVCTDSSAAIMDATDSAAVMKEATDSTAAGVVVAVSVEASVTVTQSVVTEFLCSFEEFQNKEADREPEVPNHPSGGSMHSPSIQNSQVSEVIRDLGFQVKSESISTDCASIIENSKLKGNLNADNFLIEQNVVMPEMVQPLSNDVSPDNRTLRSPVGQEPCENQDSMEGEFDETRAIVNLDKKNDASLEKLNLDRSTGDESMEEHISESRHVESKHNSDEMREKNSLPEVNDVKQENHVGLTRDSISDKGISPEGKMSHGVPCEKQKLEDKVDDSNLKLKCIYVLPRCQSLLVVSKLSNVFSDCLLQIVARPKRVIVADQEVDKNNKPPKRRRRWSSEAQKVPELQASTLKSCTTLKNAFPSDAPKQSVAKSDSELSPESAQGCVVSPSAKPPTTSLRIDNFLRPFTLKAVQELLAKTGAVCSFWMDHIKTHCYVTYSSVEEATETRNAVCNLQWPTYDGKLLFADFVDPQDVKMRAEAPAAAPVSTTPKSTSPTAPLSSKPPFEASFRQAVQRKQLPPPPPPPLMTSKRPAPTRDHLPLPPPPPLPQNENPRIVAMDDFFMRTTCTPRIYFLPLSEEQVAAKLATQGKNTK
ncbi:uncharacterized protein LOC113290482 [Papaver somniferum]|uniref:uncharacterized protein LOC113290482 n=1 Tax=Papaver somniferum TaxID=3469 RepID=UPI000E6FFC0C|nr:uncharacterized protein LOC113290482 [Papaver somniferum]